MLTFKKRRQAGSVISGYFPAKAITERQQTKDYPTCLLNLRKLQEKP